jgi:hypothetical protein
MIVTAPPLTERIRRAVASGEFQKALVLWNDYAGQLQEALEQRRLSEPQLKEMGELVEWSRTVVLCARAQGQSLLSSLCAAGKYSDPVPRNEPRIVRISL